jgi:phosphoribosylaminoimidazolecarboxamide formyltransferase/IMP cyclohydrolase
MSKKILINVDDYENLFDFVKTLSEKFNYEIFATPKSKDCLLANGIIFSDFNYDFSNLDFDIFICNFFPLSKFLFKDMDDEEVLSHYDSEGLALIQNFAKNYKKTAIITDKNQYQTILDMIKNNQLDENLKKELAENSLILSNKQNSILLNILNKSNDFLSINERKSLTFPYGENQHQKAFLYPDNTLSYDVLANKQLSYNNLLDVNLATQIVSEFYDVCAAVITKHSLPCGVALGASLEAAFQKAIDCDPISALGGVVALSKTVDDKLAKLISDLFFEVVVAADFSENALDILKSKNLKIIKINSPLKDYKSFLKKETVMTPFGILVQEPNTAELNTNSFKVVSKKQATTEMIEDMVFAWKISKYTRSNSAIIVKNLKTVGISQGQANRIEAVDIALNKACENSKDAILALDGAITTKDIILDAAQARIAGIIQPAGGSKDKEIFAITDKYEMTMVRTLLREFRHK